MKTITDPQDQSSYTVATVAHVENDVPEQVDRVNQQQILPTAISNRFLSEAVSTSTFSWVAFTVANSTSSTVNCTLEDRFDRVILAIPQISIFIGITNYSQGTLANQWPTTAIGGGNFPIYFNPFDYFKVSGNNQVARVTCRNNTGTDQQLVAAVQWKVFTVPTTTQSTTKSSV